jgi:hypothetical protein
MAQVPSGQYPVDNSTGANVRAHLNNNLTDLHTTSSGSTPPVLPSGTEIGKLWVNTSTTPDTLCIRTSDGNAASDYTTLGNIAANFGHATLASPTFTGNVGFPAGGNTNLPIRNAGDTDTGIYFGATNQLDIRAGNIDVHSFTSTASLPKLQLRLTNGTNTAPSLSFATETNTGLFRKDANQLGITIGGTEIGYWAGNGLQINTQKALILQDGGSGSTVSVRANSSISSSFTLTLPNTDGNANDILKSDGSGGLSFVAISSLITDISGAEVTTYTSSATFTPATGRTGFLFILIGGGGSSGGGRANNDDVAKPARSGQGGTGATALKFYNASELGNNASVTVGAGGAASTGNGNAGGGSSVNPQGSGTTCTAGGGGGSAYAGQNVNTAGGAAGNCSNHLLGWHGTIGLAGNVSGYAGPNPPEFTAYDYGKGGAGKDHPDAANSAGNAGGAGFVVVFQW